MHIRSGITLTETVAMALVVVVVVTLAVVLSGPGCEREMGGHGYICMSSLNSISKAIIIYKGENDGEWPWLYDTITEWDKTAVGTNRDVSPFGEKDDPNNPKHRSVTSLMFMLVRMNQSPGMFRCPSDRNSEVDLETKADANDGDILEGEYYWDFSTPQNVSYSYQAPRYVNSTTYANGVNKNETEVVVLADMTPAATNPGWKPADVTELHGAALETQVSPNHNGKEVNVLRVGGDVQSHKRPDVGVDKDNIYTASGAPSAGSRSATSLDIRKHLSARDTFLIGPVAGKAK